MHDLRISFPEGAGATVMILLRWAHVLAGIAWVGLLYFFVLVNARFLAALEPATRARVIPLLTARAMWWFRWASVITVLTGISYWMHTASLDASAAGASPGRVFWTFFALWTVAFGIEMGLLMAPKPAIQRGIIVGPVVAIALLAAAYLYLYLNNQGWETNRVLSIGIGGGLGWFMMLNVWGIIWRAQKKLIRWSEANPGGGAMPEKLAAFLRVAALASKINFVLTFPMLFFMVAASHYPFLG